MRFKDFSFGSIWIDGTTYQHDVVIDRGHALKREKKAFQEIPRLPLHTLRCLRRRR